MLFACCTLTWLVWLLGLFYAVCFFGGWGTLRWFLWLSSFGFECLFYFGCGFFCSFFLFFTSSSFLFFFFFFFSFFLCVCIMCCWYCGFPFYTPHLKLILAIPSQPPPPPPPTHTLLHVYSNLSVQYCIILLQNHVLPPTPPPPPPHPLILVCFTDVSQMCVHVCLNVTSVA